MNLIRLFERMQNYQYEQNSDPDKILDLNVRTLTEDDIDRWVSVCVNSLLKKVPTFFDFQVSCYRYFLFAYWWFLEAWSGIIWDVLPDFVVYKQHNSRPACFR